MDEIRDTVLLNLLKRADLRHGHFHLAVSHRHRPNYASTMARLLRTSVRSDS